MGRDREQNEVREKETKIVERESMGGWTYGTRHDPAVPAPSLGSCSCLCMTRVVYGAMLMKAGKRTGASILRAADLSADLCSKRCRRRDGCPSVGTQSKSTAERENRETLGGS